MEVSISMIGKIVDLPLEEFKEALKEQNVNVGVISNLILTLENIYWELNNRKDGVISLLVEKKKTQEEVDDVLKGVYQELAKMEEKIVYLKDLKGNLSKLDCFDNQ